MKFTLEIELGNDAMRTAPHLARAVQGVADKLRTFTTADLKHADDIAVMDVNGNKVGSWTINQ